jgi:hypothetical protein
MRGSGHNVTHWRCSIARAPTLLAAVLLLPAFAAAQPTTYSLLIGAALRREACLPPCLCPYGEQSGPLSGSFVLTPVDNNPLFSRYTVSDISWVADLGTSLEAMSGTGIYTIGGEVALTHRVELDLTIGPLAVISHFDSGFVPADPQRPFPAFGIVATTGQVGCRRDTLTVIAAPGQACYVNCDHSITQPILTVADFTCFLSRYAAGDPYANCDGFFTPPILNVADFTCFLHAYAAGCP